jgi:hypothetical protein
MASCLGLAAMIALLAVAMPALFIEVHWEISRRRLWKKAKEASRVVSGSGTAPVA